MSGLLILSPMISVYPRPVHAFTVLELLVALGVVAILTALAAGGLSAVRSSASQVKCANNMRQISLALNQYASDHEQQLPVRGNADWIKPEPDGIWTYLYGDEDIWAHYPKFSGTVYRCPSAEANNLPAGSYGMNSIVGGSYAERIVLNRIVHKSGTMILMEADNFMVQPPGEFNGPMNLKPRHGKNINVLFLDGHIESMAYDKITEDPESTFWSIHN